METTLSTPFTTGVEKVLTSMLGVRCRRVDSDLPPPRQSISGIISMSGSASGLVALSFPRETASLLVAEMVGLDEEEVDDEILADAVGELTNIVVGNARTELSDTEHAFQISLPRVIAGVEHPVFGGRNMARHFETDLGPFSMYLSLAWVP